MIPITLYHSMKEPACQGEHFNFKEAGTSFDIKFGGPRQNRTAASAMRMLRHTTTP